MKRLFIAAAFLLGSIGIVQAEPSMLMIPIKMKAGVSEEKCIARSVHVLTRDLELKHVQHHSMGVSVALGDYVLQVMCVAEARVFMIAVAGPDSDTCLKIANVVRERF